MKTNIFISNYNAFAKHLGSIYSRLASLSIVSRQSVLAILLTIGVGNAWGATATMTGVTQATSSTVNSKTAIKCGTGSYAGSMKVTVPANATVLALYCAGWSGASVTINITPTTKVSPTSFNPTSDSGISGTGSSYTLSGSESTYLKTITLSSITTSTDITFANTAKKKQFVVWGARYVFNPTSPTNGTITSNSAQLSWSYGNSTDKYEIYYSTSSSAPSAGTTATIGISTIGTTKSHTITDLSGSTTYYWWVRAVDPDGYCKSTWVAGSSFTTTTACANSVTISKGTGTNCTFTLSKSGAQASCDGVSTTVTVSPTSGYGNPSVTQTGASAAPTITGSSNTYTVAYGANTTGTSTINVSCSANTYTITLNQDLTPTSAGTTSITATYNASTNLTSAITPPTKTGWTFAGYFTAKNGGGTQIIGADGYVIASVDGYTDSNKKWIKAGGVTLYAKWTCTVTWSVNGLTNVYSSQTVTYNASGSKVASIPGPPSPASYCGDKFMGWTTEENVSQDDDTGLGLFTTVSGSPDIKSIGDITFYAVFADYDDED